MTKRCIPGRKGPIETVHITLNGEDWNYWGRGWGYFDWQTSRVVFIMRENLTPKDIAEITEYAQWKEQYYHYYRMVDNGPMTSIKATEIDFNAPGGTLYTTEECDMVYYFAKNGFVVFAGETLADLVIAIFIERQKLINYIP